jgi:hypothetical protein
MRADGLPPLAPGRAVGFFRSPNLEEPMISAEMRRKIEEATSLIVVSRLSVGQSATKIRREAAKVAAEAIADVVGDQWQQEAVMAEINRGIERALTGK